MATVVETLRLPDFENEPFTDFSDPENAAAMEAALEKVRGELGRTYPMVIDGKEVPGDVLIDSKNPARPSEVVGRFPKGTAQHARTAIDAAETAFETWRRTPWEERVELVVRAAELMRERKFELAAWMVYEVSKSWAEADADIAELIDFAEYYAREALRLAGPQRVHPYPGEDPQLHYIPLGVGAIISPWNFPAAIAGGMTIAAIVTGNTVVLKPAETATVIASKFMSLLIEAGLPAGVVNLLTGPGAVVGEAMVDSPKVRFIAFTGSKEVGLRIFERAAKKQTGQKWLKRTVLEMGGKDAIIVDETADIDAAAQGIAASAFGFQGQKCSACSRAIVVDDVYDAVLEKVVEHAKKVTIGDPSQKGTSMGAVIDDEAFGKISRYIAIGKTEGRLVLGDEPSDPSKGYFIEPTIIADVAPDARVAQEEIFGPVLAFIRARDFDHAMEIANGTEFGLTGSLYSQDESRIERAAQDFHVGNLYFNRKSTGAMVGVHPFGGFNMSGTDSKAGGPDYLLLFTQAKAISRKV